jgi:hypothetical protein
MISTQTTFRTAITVDAPIDRAFTVFTEGFDTWWPRGHHIGTAEMAEALIEPRVDVRFVVERDGVTRVELEHSGLDRHGASWTDLRDGISSSGGWPDLLSRFADAARL